MRIQELNEKCHIKLNRQQLEAVQAVNGPVLLLAVPGSGKTTVLVIRLGYMIHCAGIVPESILTLTYTVAATRDMAARFRAYFGDALGERLQFRTINGICSSIIQYYGRLIGKNAFSLVTDEKYGIGLLSDIYQKTENDYATESELKGIRTLITYIKNMMLTKDEIEKLNEEVDYKISEIYQIYCNELRSQGLMDFDDQMVYAYTILKNSPEVLAYFQKQYPYICVDEAQDTSKIQHVIIELLARKTGNLFMVGDEDQSIYGFRAAYPEALLSFERKYPGAKILLMEENFRSNAKIVIAADRFIQKNILRHEKHMKAVQAEGEDIREILLKSRNAQYHYLKKVAQGCQRQTAVLYRDNESVLPLVDQLEREGIPYRIRNAELSFFTHRVVLDIQNIILFAMHPKDTDLFLQVYYKLSTYINKRNALRICKISKKKNMNVLAAAIRYGYLDERIEGSCREVMSNLGQLLSERAEAALNRIVGSMGYGEYLRRSGMSRSKLFILKAIAKNEDSPQRLVQRLGELQTIIKEKPIDYHTKFILSTIHASKGLEYDTVYLMDMADGIFPESVPDNYKTIDSREREDYEEARRLFYVGVTRAKNILCIFQWEKHSTFCRELLENMGKISESHIQITEDYDEKSDSLPPYYHKKKKYEQTAFVKYYQSLEEGLTVDHKKFGKGVIIEMNEDTINIQFDDRQRKFGLKVLFENNLLSF